MERRAVVIASTLIMSLIMVIMASSDASAHDMEKVSLSYDTDKDELKVEITHRVADASDHYVNLVEVYREGNKVISQSYTSQPDPDSFSYTYALDASGGDEIKVRVTCNQLGDVEKTTTVSSNDSGTAFAFLIVGAVASVIVAGALGQRRTRDRNSP